MLFLEVTHPDEGLSFSAFAQTEGGKVSNLPWHMDTNQQ